MSGFLRWLTNEPAASQWLSRLLEPDPAGASVAGRPIDGATWRAGGGTSGGAWLGNALRSPLDGPAAGAGAHGGWDGDLWGDPGAGPGAAIQAGEGHRRRRLAAAIEASRIQQQAETEKPRDEEQGPPGAPAGIDPARWEVFSRAFPEAAAQLAAGFLEPDAAATSGEAEGG